MVKLSAFLVGSKFSAGEKGWRGQMRRDNPDPRLGSPGVVLLGHDAGLDQPGGLGMPAAASWLAAVGEVTRSGIFFSPKPQSFRHSDS